MSNHAIKRNCAHCGKPFDSYNARMTCSEECKRARKRMQDGKCRSGGGKLGNTGKCEVCGKKYAITGTMQKYCSQKCGKRARVLSGVDTVKRIPATCIICGKPFMTSKSSMAKTCGKECAAKYRTAQVKASANVESTATRPQDYWRHEMNCPWEYALFDTQPAHGASWYGAEADPMTNGAWGCDKVDERREARAA